MITRRKGQLVRIRTLDGRTVGGILGDELTLAERAYLFRAQELGRRWVWVRTANGWSWFDGDRLHGA